jgi:predicted nucleotidyltransferase
MTSGIPTDVKQVADFCRRHQVLELAIFGSVLRSDFSSKSDIDLLVTFASGAKVSLFDLVDMTDELTRLMGRQVDLVTKQGLKPQIRQSVIDSSRVIYAAA